MAAARSGTSSWPTAAARPRRPPTLAAIDPTTNSVVASIKVGARPTAVAAGPAGAWVGDTRDGTITRVDPEPRGVVTTIGIGAPVVDLATGLGGVWAATGGFGEVVQIDPEVAAVAQRVPLGHPRIPSCRGAFGRRGRRTRPARRPKASPVSIRARGTSPRRRPRLREAHQIAAGDGAVWVTTFESRAKRVEARSGRETAEYYAGGWVDPVVLDGAAWVGGQKGLAKLDRDTGVSLSSSDAAAGDGDCLRRGLCVARQPSTPEVVRVSTRRRGAVEARIATGGSGFEAAYSTIGFSCGSSSVRRRPTDRRPVGHSACRATATPGTRTVPATGSGARSSS